MHFCCKVLLRCLIRWEYFIYVCAVTLNWSFIRDKLLQIYFYSSKIIVSMTAFIVSIHFSCLYSMTWKKMTLKWNIKWQGTWLWKSERTFITSMAAGVPNLCCKRIISNFDQYSYHTHVKSSIWYTKPSVKSFYIVWICPLKFTKKYSYIRVKMVSSIYLIMSFVVWVPTIY